MALFRWLSLVLVVLALMLIGADIVSTLESTSGMVVRPLDKILLLLGADAKPWIHTNFSPSVEGVALAILSTPGWVTFGILGVILVLIIPGKRKKPSGQGATPPIAHH